MQLDSKIPSGPIEKKWDNRRFELKLVNPANKRKYKVLVVGTGLAGGSAAARGSWALQSGCITATGKVQLHWRDVTSTRCELLALIHGLAVTRGWKKRIKE